MKLLQALIILSAVVSLSAFGGKLKSSSGKEPNIFTAEKVYTLTNLHPDPLKRKLYAVNYQLAGFIPLCTEVKFVKTGKKRLIFTINNVEYVYDNHKAAAEPFADHLERFFGLKCDKTKIKKMSKVDRDGIKTGKAAVGMSKKAVILAIGYPPRHVTPSTDMNQWTYWRNRFVRTIIEFDDKGKVSNIIK